MDLEYGIRDFKYTVDSMNNFLSYDRERYIDGSPLMEIINKMYLEKKSMVDFMEKGYKFCLDNSRYIEDIR